VALILDPGVLTQCAELEEQGNIPLLREES